VLDPFFDAFEELGIPFIKEHAAGNAVGVYWTPQSMNPSAGNIRSSSLNAYFDPVSSRPNLKMLTEHQVFEVLFDGPGKGLTATGVKALDRQANREVTFKARKEVILAAGAIHTPQILQLSGIGPKSVLDAAKVQTRLDFPAVGSNYQDHPTAYINWNVTNSYPYPGILQANATFNAEALELYLNHATGPYTKAQASSTGFLSLNMLTSAASSLISSLQSQNSAAYLPPIYSDPSLLAGFNAQKKILISQFRAGNVANVEIPFAGAGGGVNSLQKPLSRGTVHLNATDPRAEPVVTNYAFQNPFDKEQLFAAISWFRKLMSAEALTGLKPIETVPGPQFQDRDSVFEALRTARTAFGSPALSPSFAHPSSSCPMMPKNKGGCVGSDLLVYGVKKLSIIDASIMPIIPAAHLQASLYAVAEKAADIIKSRK
jgi:choline dehydrogenase-like flavoprotein